ncbi:MAG: mechanosensitive ion channel, partial [Thermodesulfobacteriota bacterium]|nr:mechanosensitive ion channel [Thermodesulfobacteriota bacterium]
MSKLISTGILLLVVFGIRWIIVQDLLSRKKLTKKIRRQWIVTARNGAFFLILTGLVIIWFEQLRMFATTVVVIAVAIVIATKEFLLNIMGFLFRSGAHFFSIGDRIEIDDLKGDVIDQTIMGTIVLEIGPGTKSHQYTGRAIFIPNSKFLSHPVINET